MKESAIAFAIGVALGFVIGVLVWQTQFIRPLQSENERLRDQSKVTDELREENARLASERVDPAELKRLRDGQAELLRLRGQVSQSRREAQEAKPPASTVRRITGTPASAPTPDNAPVDNFTANVTANVGWGQALVTGGWRLPSGKRAFVFLEPSDDFGEGSVHVRSHIVEIPEELLAGFGLDGLKSENQATTGNGILSAVEIQNLLKSLEKADGATILGSPQVVTLNGRQAQFSVTESHTSPSGQTYTTGPIIDVVPNIAADKQTVQLVVGAQLNLPRVQKQ